MCPCLAETYTDSIGTASNFDSVFLKKNQDIVYNTIKSKAHVDFDQAEK